jgi:hypothetical protein
MRQSMGLALAVLARGLLLAVPAGGLLDTVLAGAGAAPAEEPTRAQVVRVAEAPASPATPAQNAVPATGEAAQIVDRAKDYHSWSRFPAYQKPKLSKGHGGTYVVAWYNPAAAPAVKGGNYPEDSIIVKENRRAPDGAPVSLTVMAKRSGSWYWLKATPDWKIATADGKPIAGKEVSSCVGCHGMAPGDMVFSK